MSPASPDPNRTVAGDFSAAALDPTDGVPTLPGAGDEVLAAEGPRPGVPGYQLLAVLGRGGMGVVYKARQVGLNRLVALKMILGGAHAAPEDMVRFLAEAEAVAQLQHTNIVQIYQVGKQGDLPFFSLEYVEGGTLAERLAGVPQQPNDAARLVECLARAMHFAHQKGIVHRDLKPANILLASGGCEPPDSAVKSGGSHPPLALCVPKITDFGLAKRVEGDHGLTRTGAVMGTPSYMAPEQAQGVKDVGPAADVYALGAVLYEMLTGRPPFRALTALDTVLQVLSSEPVPPTRLQPGVPRDLETVCLKCLQKDPNKRYASADELADDLQRFLTDRPVLARRTGTLERCRRWCRRNPMVASMTAALALLLLLLALGASVAALWLHRERDAALDSLKRAEDAERRRTEQLATSYLEQARARRFSRQAGQRFQSLTALTEAVAIVRGMSLDERERDVRLSELRNEAIACLTLTDLRPQRRLQDVFIETHGTGFQKAVAFTPKWDAYARARSGAPSASAAAWTTTAKWYACRATAPRRTSSRSARTAAICSASISRGTDPSSMSCGIGATRRRVMRQACELTVCPTIDFAFMPDGREVILGGRNDGSLGCYDLSTAKAVRRLAPGRSPPWLVALHPDGRLAHACGNEVIVCDSRTEAVLALPGGRRPIRGRWPGTAATTCWQPAAAFGFTSGTPPPAVRAEYWKATRPPWSSSPSTRRGRCWPPLLGTAARACRAPATGKELLHVPGDFLEFSPDGQRFAYVKGRELGIWQVADAGACRLLAQPGGVSRTHFSPDGRLLASAAQDDTYLWDVRSGRQLGRLRLGGSRGRVPPLGRQPVCRGGFRAVPLAAATRRNGKRPLASGIQHEDPAAAGLLPERGLPRRQRGQTGGGGFPAGSAGRGSQAPDVPRHNRTSAGQIHQPEPDGRWLATSTFKGTDVKVWDLASKDLRKPAVSFRAGDRANAFFSRDGRWLVVDEPVQTVRFFYHVGSWKLARQEAIAPGDLGRMGFHGGQSGDGHDGPRRASGAAFRAGHGKGLGHAAIAPEPAPGALDFQPRWLQPGCVRGPLHPALGSASAAPPPGGNGPGLVHRPPPAGTAGHDRAAGADHQGGTRPARSVSRGCRGCPAADVPAAQGPTRRRQPLGATVR